jgi:hypothetical protein
MNGIFHVTTAGAVALPHCRELIQSVGRSGAARENLRAGWGRSFAGRLPKLFVQGPFTVIVAEGFARLYCSAIGLDSKAGPNSMRCYGHAGDSGRCAQIRPRRCHRSARRTFPAVCTPSPERTLSDESPKLLMPHIKIIILCALPPRIIITERRLTSTRSFVHPAVYDW